MHATRGGHVAVSFSKSDHSAVAHATQEQKVWTVWSRIVISLDSFIFFDFVATQDDIPAIRIGLLQSLWIISERLPYFDQRLEVVRSDSALGC